MKYEPGEGKAHEMEESPEDEVREGSESEESEYHAKRGRKRSPRGAKHTKAPMDAEGGCCNEKKGRGKCSACASGKPCGGTMDGDCGAKRGDSSLTPQEYLAACDLGIQDRSRSYIRTRLTVMDSLTPATVQFRSDAGSRKCGNSYIPANKQCRAGAGGGAAPRKMSTGKRIVTGVMGGMSAISAAGSAVNAVRSARRGQSAAAFVQGSQALGQGLAARQYFKGNIRKGLASEVAGYGLAAGGLALNRAARTPGAQNAARRAGAAAGGVYTRARNAVRRAPTVSGQSMGSSTPGRRRASVGQQAYRVAKGASYAAGRAAGTVARMGRRRGRAVPYGTGGALRRRGDADVWAVGFEPRIDKKCGASGIADNKQCRAGSGGPGPRTLTGPNGQFSRQRIAREGWYGSQLGAKPFSYKSNAKRGAALNAVAGAVYGGALGGIMGGTRGAVRGALAGGAFGGALGAGAGAVGAGVNRATSRAAKRSLARRPAA
jgi:hypothetical protein